MSSFRKNLKYWVPFLGTRQLLKRLDRLDRELNEVRNADTSALALYYEARIESLYDAICQRISLDGPVIEKGKIHLKAAPDKVEDVTK